MTHDHACGPRAQRAPPLIAVALISAAALAYEILLMRLFSIVFWYHFAYMIISLALLGYGAAGALLTMARSAVEQRFAPLFSAAAAAFGVSAIGCFALAQRVPFSPLENPLGSAPAGLPAGGVPAARTGPSCAPAPASA